MSDKIEKKSNLPATNMTTNNTNSPLSNQSLKKKLSQQDLMHIVPVSNIQNMKLKDDKLRINTVRSHERQSGKSTVTPYKMIDGEKAYYAKTSKTTGKIIHPTSNKNGDGI